MSLTTISYISLAASLIVRIANKFGFVHKIIFLCNCSILYTECLPLLKSKNTVLDVRNVREKGQFFIFLLQLLPPFCDWRQHGSSPGASCCKEGEN